MANNGWYKLENERQQSNGRKPQGQKIPVQNGPQNGNWQFPNAGMQNRQPGRPPVERNQHGSEESVRKMREAPPRAKERMTEPPARPTVATAGGRPVTRPNYPGEAIHSQTVGADGPVVVQDEVLHETLETFVHEKIMERAVHVKGFGALGHFQTLHSMREYTTASIFQTPGQQVQALSRFSLAVSTKGTPDTGRNVRGFSTKFYTPDGIFDLLTNHLPVFLVRDAMRFPDSIKAFLPSPKNNLADPERFWGFVAKSPEATHFVTWLYSDVGTIKSLRKQRYYGVNTYVWKNARGEYHLVKYHWIPTAGQEFIDRQEAVKLAGENPDIAGQDLYDAIEKGAPVEFELRVQLMPPTDVQHLEFDPLDDTKTWDEEQYPLLPVGKLTLNRNPDDYNEQIEKVAFSPANLLDGIELSNDKMLQGRSFIYWDAQRYRLGPDFRKIPVNKQADFDPSKVRSSGIGQHTEGIQARTELIKTDNFAQAGERYGSLSAEEQKRLADNIAVELPLVSRETQNTVLEYLSLASKELGQQVLKQMTLYMK